MNSWSELTLYAGLDWAGDHHDIVVVDPTGAILAQLRRTADSGRMPA